MGPAALAATPTRKRSKIKEPVVAYIGDAAKGELLLLIGEEEVVVHDRDLVNRLLNSAGR